MAGLMVDLQRPGLRGGGLSEHPSPARVYETATKHAALLRELLGHPDYKYREPPNATIVKHGFNRTPKGLFFVAEFVQKTYVKYVVPFLPAGATRKCKDISNPWAYADPDYSWEWTFDTSAGIIKDADGNTVEFPRLPDARREAQRDIFTRIMMAQKIIVENESDATARMLLGGKPFDFGDDARKLIGGLIDLDLED
ncbi:hypothetical protein F5Y15DRAFT_425690 [Xylariaceae sp. FL0016]|nr:hypothetical protein F5Y15DRAFT_425690 [Xylariaceae sp. FL0016]